MLCFVVICHQLIMVPILDIISYPLFTDADAGIYPHTPSQYHAQPKAKRGIAILSVDKFPYPWKQTKGNKFVQCLNDVCYILKRFCRFETPAIHFILPKSSYKLIVARSHRSGKESGWRQWSLLHHHCEVINDVHFSLYLMLMMSNVKYVSVFHGY